MFYNIFQGGLRSAILADAVQGLVMIGCSVVIIIHGFFIANGPLNVFEVSKERNRLDFFKLVQSIIFL